MRKRADDSRALELVKVKKISFTGLQTCGAATRKQIICCFLTMMNIVTLCLHRQLKEVCHNEHTFLVIFSLYAVIRYLTLTVILLYMCNITFLYILFAYK